MLASAGATLCLALHPNAPRRVAKSLVWSSRRVQLVRAVLDGTIGLSVAVLFVWVSLDIGGWFGITCCVITSGLVGVGAGVIGVWSILRAALPRVEATLTPTPHGWHVRYSVRGGLLCPRRVAVTVVAERGWTQGTGKEVEQRLTTPSVQTLADHARVPASGEVEVVLADYPLRGRRNERVRHFLIFHGGMARWPDLHESVRLPTPPDPPAHVGPGRGRKMSQRLAA